MHIIWQRVLTHSWDANVHKYHPPTHPFTKSLSNMVLATTTTKGHSNGESTAHAALNLKSESTKQNINAEITFTNQSHHTLCKRNMLDRPVAGVTLLKLARKEWPAGHMSCAL